MTIDNGSLILEKPGKTSPALGSLPIEENQFSSIMGRDEIQGRLSRFFRLTTWCEPNRVGVHRLWPWKGRDRRTGMPLAAIPAEPRLCGLPPRAPGVGLLLAGVGAACGLDAVGPEPGDLGDEGVQGGLVEVGEPAAAAHAVVGAYRKPRSGKASEPRAEATFSLRARTAYDGSSSTG